jgi:uncharacterized damage-inducible protein DinB
MLPMIRDLVAHKNEANIRLLDAIRNHPDAADDSEVIELLHHILVANRFWFLTISGQPFVAAQEMTVPGSLDVLTNLYVATHREEEAWMARTTADDLDRTLQHFLIPGGRCTVAQGIMQVCLHSHGHRAQLMKMLRRHGGTPPMTDFILWVAQHQPQPGPDRVPEIE